MRKRKYLSSIFITDENISIFCRNEQNEAKNKYSSVSLNQDTINFGYISNPIELYQKLKKTFKKLKFKPKELNWVIQDQNILIREISIDKEELVNTSLDEYIKNQNKVTILNPFDKATFAYKIKNDTDKTLTLVIFIMDQNLIEDYLDIFEKLSVNKINYSIISESISYLYNDKNSNILDNSMVVSILDNSIAIHIIENQMTIFGMIDECEYMPNNSCNKIEEYIERIANYYQYNLRKGQQKINYVFILDMLNANTKSEDYYKIMSNDLKNFKIIPLQMQEINSLLKDTTTNIDIAYISAKALSKPEYQSLNFSINRQNKNIVFTNYLLVLSIAIFAIISLIYLPYINMQEKINNQESINNALLIQKNMLNENVSRNISSNYEKSYNETYLYLDSQIPIANKYIQDLITALNKNIYLRSFEFDAVNKEITITINADSESDLYEYIINIYENYSINNTVNLTKQWMTLYPETTFTGNLTMKAVIHYA